MPLHHQRKIIKIKIKIKEILNQEK